MAQKKKIMVITPALAGHVTPMCGLLRELCKNKNIEVLYYSEETYRETIEKTGAKLRLNEKQTFSKFNFNTISNMEIGDVLSMFIGFAYDDLPQYIAEVEKEKPDLILYDGMSFSGKFLVEIIEARHANGDEKIHLPNLSFSLQIFPSMIKR